MSTKNRVAANLNMLFTHLPLIERYAAAAEAGFKLVEISLPYSESGEKLREIAEKHNLSHTLINAPPGNWGQGFRGICSLKTETDNFRASLEEAIRYANVLNCKRVHIMAGIPKEEQDISNAHSTYLSNLKWANQQLEAQGIQCLIEPINQYTIPGYFLNSYDQALKILEDIASSNLKIQYDFFHAQQINGQLISTVSKLKDYIGYIQVAQVPHRGSCGSRGEIDYSYIFQKLAEINPSWIIGCEYTDQSADFDWIQKMNLDF